MATVTIRPDAAGNIMNWNAEGGDYTRVDEVVSDGDSTRLYTPTPNNLAQFNLGACGLSGITINSVTAYLNIRGLDPVQCVTQVSLRTHSTDYLSGNKTWTNQSYHEESNVWTTNPNTSSAWTVAEVDALQTGMKFISGGGQAVTQVWVVVDYTAGASGPTNVKSVNGIAIANVKSVNGIAIASVKSINGIT